MEPRVETYNVIHKTKNAKEACESRETTTEEADPIVTAYNPGN